MNIIDHLEMIARMHRGEDYPSCEAEINAISEVVWQSTGKTTDLETVREKVVSFFQKDINFN